MGEHFRVHAEISLPGQRGHHGAGDRTDSGLESGAVLDHRRDELADLRLDRVGRFIFKLEDRAVALNQRMQPGDVDEAVAERARHVAVHLGHDAIGAFDHGFHHVHRHTQAAKAVGIRRSHLHERDIEMDAFPAEQCRHFAE